jgi:hypothetical protein
MPYITKDAREELYDRDPENAGELQYLIAMMISDYISDKDQYDYQTLNDVMGALAGAQQEFYRKIVAPYEEKKELLNGSVY